MLKSMIPNLMVENVEDTTKFYESKLGFITAASVPDGNGGLQFAIMIKDELTLMFQEKSNLITEYPILTTDELHPSISLYIQTDDLEQLYSDLKKSLTIYTDMHTTFYGAKEFAVLDNNNYVLTFTEERKQ